MSAELLDDFRASIIDGLKTRTLTTCLRWANYRRVMGHPFPGPYTTKYHPWCAEMHNSKAPFNYARKGAQLGVTEVAINRAFYTLDQLKRDVLYVLPTTLNAGDFSKARFNTALAESPYLKGLFTDTNAINLKQAGSNTLYIRGSRGDSNLKSIPVSELILDEVDEMAQRQIWLALERLSGQKIKNVFGLSTPTIPERGIDLLYKDSTQETFNFRCPSCSRWTELVWPDCIEVIGEFIGDPRCHESYLKCKECKNKLSHEAKPEWLSTAKWVANNSNANTDVRGFAISQLYSFTVTPGEIAVAHFRGLGDEYANKEFHNSKLGLPFIGDGAKVTDEMIGRSVRPHTMDAPRPRVGGDRLITLGVDQGKWSYWTIVEWMIQGDPGYDVNSAALAKVLAAGKFLEDDWGRLDELMREFQILACVIDADPQINEARRFARRFPGYVWLCRYRRGQTGKEMSEQDGDTGAPLVTVDRTSWMSATLSRFKSDPTRIHLPADISAEFREHLKSPVRTYQKPESPKNEKKQKESESPVAVYVETGPDHYAHSLTYAEIALPLAQSITTGQDVKAFL
jgi:hypothetical protein